MVDSRSRSRLTKSSRAAPCSTLTKPWLKASRRRSRKSRRKRRSRRKNQRRRRGPGLGCPADVEKLRERVLTNKHTLLFEATSASFRCFYTVLIAIYHLPSEADDIFSTMNGCCSASSTVMRFSGSILKI